MGLSQHRLARDISVPPRCINEIVHRKRAITADTALRLARYFSTSAEKGDRSIFQVEGDRSIFQVEENKSVTFSSIANPLR